MHGILKKVTKKRFELEPSYLMKKLSIKLASAKHIIILRRMGGVVVVEDDFEVCAKKITFHMFTHEIRFSIATRG
jgi:hypothetical protein